MSEEPTAGPDPEPAPEKEGPSKLERAAGIAQKVLRHKQLLVAAMEVLRENKALSEDEEVKIMSAYETGSVAARAALSDLVERLQQANLGKVVVNLSERLGPIGAEDLTMEGFRAKARPAIQAAKQEFLAEAKPYIERAKQRLMELKALEEPTLKRLEAITGNLRDVGKEVAIGLKGAGREAADELVRRGKRWWMSAETEELEREVFDWVLKALPRAERTLVRVLISVGILLFATGILLAAQEIGVLRQVAIFVSIFLLLGVGLTLINWGIKISEALKSGRGQIEALAHMTPQERRVYLAKRWAERAQKEGVLTPAEAQDVIEQTIMATEEPPAGPSLSSKLLAQLPKSP